MNPDTFTPTTDLEPRPGWCCVPGCASDVGCACVVVRGVVLCLPCWEAEKRREGGR